MPLRARITRPRERRATITPRPRPAAPSGMLGPPSAPVGPAPVPAATPGAGAMPLDPTYLGQLGLNQASRDMGLAGIQYDRGRTEQDYGFVDTSNPYNRAAMLQRTYQESQRGTTNSMAARGQLYSGALQSQLGEGTFNYNRAYDSLRRDYDDRMQGFARREQQTRFGFEQANNDAGADRAARWADYRPVDPGPVRPTVTKLVDPARGPRRRPPPERLYARKGR